MATSSSKSRAKSRAKKESTDSADLKSAQDRDSSLEAVRFAEFGASLRGGWGKFFALTAGSWSLFQIWIASPLPFLFDFAIIHGVAARAIHLAFAFALVFMLYPLVKPKDKDKDKSRESGGATGGATDGATGGVVPRWYDLALGILAVAACLYIVVFYDALVERVGVLLELRFSIIPPFIFGEASESAKGVFPIEFIVGFIGLLLLLESTRRAIGLPLVFISVAFIAYSLLGQSMPDLIAHRGLSFDRLIGYYWFGAEVVFGIPLDVATSFVFMFVLFGALLERAGGGKFFIDLSFALVGKYRGGPAKASILASGMTGMISGSSIANTVTTGTFTIPVMRKVGLPAVKAGAIEVAASVNGQLMPPIMGAAAFIMAELLGISYREVIYHAFVPAVIAYLALFWISHLESMKLGLRPMAPSDIPRFFTTLTSGLHFLLPIAVLIYLLLVERFSASSAVFWATASLLLVMVAQRVVQSVTQSVTSASTFASTFFGAFYAGLLRASKDIGSGLVAGARNMAGISIAVGCAGIIVGSVGATGLNNALIGIIESIAGNNIYILLALTAVLCLVLGLGLPTTANYLVVASLMAPVLVELGSAAGLVLPLIVVHLYVFYFGLMADVTPPVGLAAYAASAISRADPIKTGIQAFAYEIRTAILPVVFVFNTELVLIGIKSWWHGVFVFTTSLLAILCFTTASQRFLFRRLRLFEMLLLLMLSAALFRPDGVLSLVYPRWQTVELSQGLAQTSPAQTSPAQTSPAPTEIISSDLRVAITRKTDYGDRYRLVNFTPSETQELVTGSSGDSAAGFPSFAALGLGVEPRSERSGDLQVEEQGVVAYLAITSLTSGAEAKGLRLGDRITKTEVRVVERPSPYWVSMLAVLLLALFFWRHSVSARATNLKTAGRS